MQQYKGKKYTTEVIEYEGNPIRVDYHYDGETFRSFKELKEYIDNSDKMTVYVIKTIDKGVEETFYIGYDPDDENGYSHEEQVLERINYFTEHCGMQVVGLYTDKI